MVAGRLSFPRTLLVVAAGFLVALPVPFLFAFFAYEWGSLLLRLLSMVSVLFLPVVAFRLAFWRIVGVFCVLAASLFSPVTSKSPTPSRVGLFDVLSGAFSRAL